MKRALFLIAAAALLAACGGTRKVEKSRERTLLCGGYTQQRALDAQDLELFRRATDALTGVKYTPLSVATQVVAGTNYRFVCKAKTATLRPQTYKAEVVVFQPLPGRGEAKITRIKRL